MGPNAPVNSCEWSASRFNRGNRNPLANRLESFALDVALPSRLIQLTVQSVQALSDTISVFAFISEQLKYAQVASCRLLPLEWRSLVSVPRIS